MTARGISRGAKAGGRQAARSALLAGVAASALVLCAGSAFAQASLGDLGAAVSVPDDAQLFLAADTVTYDSERAVVTAAGGVQIDYGDYKLVSRNIVYDQTSRRLVASGDVELIEPTGNRIYADAIDITDDFRTGFVDALRIETPDNTRFAARQAVRENGNVTTFEQGVYTACEACRENPERPPLWQVKARRIVWDQQDQVIRYYGARFELFGKPLAYLPYFASPDPTVRRQSGLLAPSFKSSGETGFGLRVPYYFAIDDTSDATVAGTYFSKQGFLGELEYRKATENGYFTLQTAGIRQRDPDAFGDFRADNVLPAITDPSDETRGMIGTTGRFALDERWTFGWDILAQSDTNFSNVYEIENFSQIYRTSEIYLTGLGDQSFFDLRTQRFDVQSQNTLLSDIQPLVLPTLDYQRIDQESVLGGQVQIDVNVTNLTRETTSPGFLYLCESLFITDAVCRQDRGVFPYRQDFFRRNTLEGDYSRSTAQAEWKRTLQTDAGFLLTPSLSGRADLYRADMQATGLPFGASPLGLGGTDIDEAGGRGMATAGLDARYPFLLATANTSHVVTPIGQLFVRPDEMDAGRLPNEDAQSLVFSTANLFSPDKFSGYDRIEGGTRANVGVQYSGVFGAGYSLDAMVGQSYHLGGENPYAQVDRALVGFDSGLETDRSDYVSSVALATPFGVSLGAQGRFDEESLELRRADLMGGTSFAGLDTTVMYSQIAAQPIYGFPEDRQQVTATARYQVTNEVSTFGSVSFDLENSAVIDQTLGIGYADECFSLIAQYQNTSDRYNLQSAETRVMFRLSLRTLADADFGYGLGSSE